MNNISFGTRLKKIIKANGYTQQALAEKAGIDEKHLSRIENGKFSPSYKTLNKLLNALDITITDIDLDFKPEDSKQNKLYSKALQILNSAKDSELPYYIEALKLVQKTLKHID